jgi:thioredoxin 1
MSNTKEDNVIEVNSENFEREVINSEKVVVMDLWASWCAPCQMMGHIISEVSNELTQYKFVKVNVDEEPELAKRFLVSSIPLIVVLKGGEEIGRFTGFRPAPAFKNEINELVMNYEMK